MNARDERRGDALLIAALAVLAATVRALVWQRTAAIFNDGPVFIGLARLIDEGEWGAVIAHPFHPLYPLAIAVSHLGFEDWETAAVAVSVVSGAAAVALLFVFLRDAFDRRTAWIGGLVLAVHPYAVFFASDVQSDGLYLACFLGAVALLWKAFRSGRWPLAAAAGGAAGIAYLIRPEGVGAVLVGVALAALAVARRRWSPGRGIAWVAALTTAALLLMAPYLVALRGQTGAWVLTQKKSMAALSGLDPDDSRGGIWRLDATVDGAVMAAHPFLETVVRGPRAPALSPAPAAAPATRSAWARHGEATRELGLALISTLRPELLVVLLVGCFSPRRRPGPRGTFVLGFAGLYLVVLYGLALGAGYVSRRHVLPPLTVALGYAAVGVPIVGSWIASGGRRALRVTGRPPAWLAAALGAMLVIGIAAPKVLKPRRVERLAEKRAAEWLRDQPHHGGAVAAKKLRVAYYADSPYVPLPRGRKVPLIPYLREADARYMIVDEQLLDADSDLGRAAREGMRVVYRVEARGRSAAVFTIEQAH
jgi:hypothetical protein